ncbi:hypothetical protein IT398_01275 [Candidatus Nomurabacteria bacterium]|nr:hypothetical protein [Candidatus Nomurabacteria bacterium]
MAEKDPKEERLREARSALGGDKIIEREKVAEKRRREAILAMEGEKHRERRERSETENIARQNIAQAKIKKAAAETAAVQAASARAKAERAQAEEDALEQSVNQRNKINQSEELTEKLKGTTTKLSGFRTIKTDMARAVRERGLSLSKIATISDRHNGKDTLVSTRGRLTWLIWPLIFILIGTAGYFGWQWWQTSVTATKETPPPILENSIMRADFIHPISLDALTSVSQARETIDTTAKQKNEQNGLINIQLTKLGAPIIFGDFQKSLGLNLPEGLTRHLRDNFFFGVYDNGETRTSFLILQTSFFDQAWSAMFDWERYMASDLGPVLDSVNVNESIWVDRVLRNKDARELVDKTDNSILIYGFIDEKTILITRNESTFVKVFERLIDQI